MVVDVTGDRHESKVLKAVVSLIAVDMVYLLPAPELAAKMLAHDEAMLKDVEPAARDLDVPVVSPSANRLATRVAVQPRPSGEPSSSHISAARAWWMSCSYCTGTLKGLRAARIGSHAGFSRARDFGKPLAYTQHSVSRMTQPASSRAHVKRWTVRVPPNANR